MDYQKQSRINHSGAPYQRKAGAFFRTRSQDFLWRCTFPPNSWRPFLVVVVTFKPTLNVQALKQRGRSLAVDRGGLPGGGALSHGTTGTMVNPALTRKANAYLNWSPK